LCHSPFGSLSTIDSILSGNLSTFLRESTNKEFLSHTELACHMTDWERPDFSMKDFLEKLLHEKNIPF